MLFLGIGLTTNGISSVLGHTVVALQKTRISAVVTIISQVVSIILFLLFTPRMGHTGLALASSLGPIAIALMYFFYLRRIIPNLRYIFWHLTYVKIIVLTALLTGTVVAVSLLTESSPVWVRAIAPTLAGAAVYLLGAHLWRIPEMQQFAAILQNKRKSLKSTL